MARRPLRTLLIPRVAEAATVQVDFTAAWDPATESLTFTTGDERFTSPLGEMVNGELRTAQQGNDALGRCLQRVSNGAANTISIGADPATIGFDNVACGFVGPAYAALGTFCFDADVTSNFSTDLTNVIASVDYAVPAENGPYAFPLGTAANPAVYDPSDSFFTDSLAIFLQGETVAPGATATAQWLFQYTPGAFSFGGSFSAEVTEECNGADTNCDGIVDNGAGCYALGETCTINADCSSFNCDAGVCGAALPEDCGAAGDEDGNGVEGCDDLACSGLTDPSGATCADTTSCTVDEAVGALIGATTGTNLGAGDDYDLAGGDGEDYTILWTVPSDGEWTLSLCGSDYDTIMEVFDADCGSTVSLYSNDDGCGATGGPSQVTFTATAGDQYRVVIDGWNGATGNFEFRALSTAAESSFGAGACTDGQDNNGDGLTDCDEAACGGIDGCPATPGTCDNALVISGYGTFTGDTSGASSEQDPATACYSGTSAPELVYSWYALATGTVTADFTGSSYDTVVSVRTACGDVTSQVACNDDRAFLDTDSAVVFDAIEGEQYFIHVDGAGASGAFTFDITGPPPASFDCAEPGQLVGYGQYSGSLSTAASSDTTASTCGGLGVDRTYLFQGVGNGDVTVSLDADFPASISVRTDCADSGTELGCTAGDGTAATDVTFAATQNTNYYIVVEGVGATDEGDFTMTISGASPPAETCADPNTLSDLGTYTTDTSLLGNNQTLTCSSTSSSTESVFLWTAPSDMSVTASTAGSLFDTALEVRDSACGDSAAAVDCNDDEDLPGGVSTST